jgi:hydrophobe/amphiphile efflux-1 (HAE1) family protein
MKLADVSIKRPVFATMMIMSLIVLGLFSYYKLNVDLYPDVDIPFVVITTILPGAGPEQIETDITKIIEDAVNTVEGVDYIQSTSQENVSLVVIAFKLEINGKDAAQNVREKIAAVRANLPDEIEDPVIQRYDPASLPIMSLTVSGDLSDKDITTYTKDVIKKRLENIPGVGAANIVGGAEREIQIDVDAAKLKAYNMSVQDVIMNVGGQNVEIPGGNLIEGKTQLLVRTMGKYKNVEDFNRVIVATPMGKPVYLSDVATVVDGVVEKTSLARTNGKIAVGINIIKQSGSNTVEVAKGVNKQLDKLKSELPAGVNINVALDNSTFIKDSINDVLFDILYGGLLAVIVIYLFLANFRATMISGLALPASIIASFIVMFALSFTLNMMSLLALSLAVGLLIDDAIVVIENIYRHMSMGETPMEAAKSASEEIGLAVMATTFTIVAVFVPVAFMPGIVGRFFYQFGLTISAAVVVSLFVAFTLTPMLSSRLLHREDEENLGEGNILQRSLYKFNHWFDKLNAKYEKALHWSLTHRKTIVFGSIVIFILSMSLIGMLGSQFFPDSDQSQFNIIVESAPGSSLEQTSLICEKVESIIRSKPEVTLVLTTIGANNDPVTKATILVKLVHTKERNKSDKEIMAELRNNFKSIPGAKFSARIQSGPGGNDKPVTLSIRGDDITEIQKIAAKVEAIVKNTPGAVDVENSLELSKPEVRINIDREKASDLAINPFLIASTVRAFIDGAVATQYKEGDEQFDVRVRVKPDERRNISDLSLLSIKSNKKINGQDFLIPITDVATITQDIGPSKVNRYSRQREIRVSANLDKRFLGDVLGDVLKETGNLELKSGYSINVIGMGQMQEESMNNMMITLLLAIVFVYIVLAAQFDSFVYPFSIMLALPMSIIGAVLALLVFGSSLSVMSMIGIIMLMGLVTKNGILLVDYTNVLRERGMPRFEALLKAGPTRLRPILMTTFAMIFGMIPVALALGEGAEFRAPMGQAVIGGLITSTLLTLFIVPVVYSMLDDLSNFFSKNKKNKSEK